MSHQKKSANVINSLETRIIEQLDTLAPFLALDKREIFDVLSSEYGHWYPNESLQSTIPDSYEKYSRQVRHAAFLLGYSYAEAFVSDLMWIVYSCRKDLLPVDQKISFGDILSRNDFENVVEHMIERTIGGLNSLEKKINHLEKKFGFKVSQPPELKDAHVARNALIHNAGIVNRHRSGSRYSVGETVCMSASEIHDFGHVVREYIASMCKAASALCNGDISA